jgi:hypothetical protein
VAYLVKVYTGREFTLLRNAYHNPVHDALMRSPPTGLKRAQDEFENTGLGLTAGLRRSAHRSRITSIARRRSAMSMLAIRTCEMSSRKERRHTDTENETFDCGESAYSTRMQRIYRTFVPRCHLKSAGIEKLWNMPELPVLQNL